MSDAVMLKVDGQPFRCGCGGNVFHKETATGWYVCNSCGVTYEGSTP